MMEFDQKDQELLDARIAAREAIDVPIVGDFVVFETGEVERFSHEYDDAFQTSPIWAGSFYMFPNGHANFSGSLNPAIPRESLSLDTERRIGKFWFFHHDHAGAGRGVQFVALCKVWHTTAPYKGYITKGN